MKSLVFFTILALCTACAPQRLQEAEPSKIPTATNQPAYTLSAAPTMTPTLLLFTPTPVFEVLIDGLAAGPQGQLYASGFGAYGNDVRKFAEWDGENWIALGDGFSTAGNSLAVDRAGRLYTERLKESEQGIGTAVIRWDGTQWEDITGNFNSVVDALQAGRISSNVPVQALAMDGDNNLFAVGSFYYPSVDYINEFPMGYVARWDGERWTVLGQGFDQVYIFALALSESGKVFVSGEQPRNPEEESSSNGFVAEWDGEKWSQIGTSKLSSCLNINKLAADNAGGLYASCMWNGAGELIFHWDGRDWSMIADQLTGEAPYVADMGVGADGRIYIGGSFDAVSRIPARNIAAWDGTSWHALGEGVNERVYALALDASGELYVVGYFTEAGSILVDHAARWDGNTWHTLVP